MALPMFLGPCSTLRKALRISVGNALRKRGAVLCSEDLRVDNLGQPVCLDYLRRYRLKMPGRVVGRYLARKISGLLFLSIFVA